MDFDENIDKQLHLLPHALTHRIRVSNFSYFTPLHHHIAFTAVTLILQIKHMIGLTIMDLRLYTATQNASVTVGLS